MRRGRRWVFLVAIAAGLAVVAGSDLEREVERRERLPVAEAHVREDLARIRREAEAAGFTFVREVPLGEQTLAIERVAIDEADGCVLGALGAWGRRHAMHVRTYPPATEAHVRRAAAAYDEVIPTRVLIACVSGSAEEREADSIGIRASVFEAFGEGEGGSAALLLMRGHGIAPAIFDGAPVEAVRVTMVREAALGPPLINAGVTLLFVLLVGLLVEASLHRRGEPALVELSLRRISLAVPPARRPELSELADAAASGELAALRALREALVRAVEDAHAGAFAAWREPGPALEARTRAQITSLEARRTPRAAGYRAAGGHAVVVTLLVEHRCELPDLPKVLDRRALRAALDACLPVDPRELIRARVTFEPADRAEALDAETLASRFPELVPLADAPGAQQASCASCGGVLAWAPGATRPQTCKMCGEVFVVRV